MSEVRERVLDGVVDQLGQRAWPDVTLSQVARSAGVSRQTVYNLFGSRRALAQAAVLREADRLLDEIEAAVQDRLDDPEAALAAAFDVVLAAARDDPFVRAVLRGDEELLALVTIDGAPLLARARARIAEVVTREWLPAEPAEMLADAVVRLAISAASLPGPDGRAIAALLAPYVRARMPNGV